MIVKEFINGSDEYIGSGTLRDVLVELWHKRPKDGLFISVPSDDSFGNSLRKKCEDRPYWVKLKFKRNDDNDDSMGFTFWIILPDMTRSFKVWHKCPFKGFVDLVIESLTQDNAMFRYIKQHDTVMVTNVESPDKLSQLTTDDLNEHNSLQDAAELLKNVCECIYITGNNGVNGMSFDVTDLDDEAVDHIMNIIRLATAVSVSLVSDVVNGEIRSSIVLKWTDTDKACSQLHSCLLA